MSKNILDGVARGLNNVASSQSLTTQTMSQIINSPYTKETIRSIILDPIGGKLIPKLKYSGYREVQYAAMTLYSFVPEKFLEKISVKSKNARESCDTCLASGENFSFFHHAVNQSPYANGKPHTMIFVYDRVIIYVQLLIDYEERYIFTWDFYFVGANSKKVHDEFEKKYKEIEYFCNEGKKERFQRRVDVYTFEGGRRPRHGYATVPSTVIVDHVENELNAVMDMVKRSENVANEFDINKTTGVLLYGPHGTGKSTIARWFAMNLKRSLLLTNADTLMKVIEYVKDRPSEKFIILIEDIDFKFVDRRDSKKDDKNQDMMKNTDLLFQVLDGVLGENNLMVIATTNYIDRLDPALIRDSRFDFRIEVLGLTYEEAAKVCERFKVTPEEIKLSEWETPISPASLQTYILKYKVTKKD